MEIVADWSQVEALEGRLMRVPGGLPKAMERALNRTGTGMVALSSQGVRGQYTTRAKSIKERLWVTKASARLGAFESRVDPKREGFRRLSLMHFAVRPLSATTGRNRPKQGLRVQVRKDGGGYLPHSFVAHGRNIATGEPTPLAVFQRAVKGGPRLPIVKLRGPSVASQMKSAGVRERIIPEAQKRLDARLVHECRHVLRQAGLMP